MPYRNKFYLIIFLMLTCLPTVFADMKSELPMVDFFIQNQQYQKALNLCQKLYQQNPSNRGVQSRLKEIFTKLEDFEGLENLYLKQIETHPHHPNNYLELADLYFEQNEIEKYEDILSQLLKQEKYNSQIVKLIYDKLIANGENQKAIDLIRLSRKELDNPDFFAFDLANLYDLEGRTFDMLEEYFKILVLPTSNYQIRNQKNFIKEEIENKSLADPAIFKKVKSLVNQYADQDFSLQLLIGKIYYKNNQMVEAGKIYADVDLRAKSGGNIFKQLIDICRKDQKYPDALVFLQQLNKKFNREVSYETASLYNEWGKIDSAVFYFKKALNNNRLSSDQRNYVYNQLSLIFTEKQPNIDLALEYTEKIDLSRMHPQSVKEITLRKGSLILRSGDLEKALNYFDQLGKNQSQNQLNFGDIYFFLGKIKYYQGFEINAKELFKMVTKFTTSKYFNEAVEFLTLIENFQEKNDLSAAYKEALWLYEQMKYKQAYEKFTQLIQEHADFSLIQKFYVVAVNAGKLADQDQNWVELALKGIDSSPESFDAMHLNYILGAHFFQTEEYERSLEYFQTILKSANGIAFKSDARKKIAEINLKLKSTS